MTLKYMILTGCLLVGAAPTTAQTAIEYNDRNFKHDCSQYWSRNKRGIGNRAAGLAAGSKSRARKAALTAARDAISSGYNYAIMRPWTRKDFVHNVPQRDTTFGIPANLGVKKTGYNLLCSAITDAEAYDYLWGDARQELDENPELELVDLRSLITTLAPDTDITRYRVRRPTISDKQFKIAGQREVYFRTLPVRDAALACYGSLAPISETEFRRPRSPGQGTEIATCMQALAPQVQAAGWSDFPALAEADAAKLNAAGYTINRSTDTSLLSGHAPTSTPHYKAVTGGQWGAEGWFDLSPGYPQADGPVMQRFYESNDRVYTIYVIASNTTTQEQLMDHVVYISARSLVTKSSYRGMQIEDKTEAYKSSFNLRKSYIARREKESREECVREDESRLYRLGLTQGIIESVQRNIDRELKKQASANGQAEADKTRARLAELRAELAERQVKERELLKPIAPPSIAEDIARRLESDDRNGEYYLLEQNYKNILFFEVQSTDSYCPDYAIVCTDILRAYNAIGSRIQAAEHVSYSPPHDYKPYTADR